MSSSHRWLRQAFRYAGTAGVAAIVDIALFAALIAIGLHIALAACLSFVVAMFVNYGLTSHFVFHAPLSLRRLLAFISGASAGFIVNVSATWVLAALFGVPAIAAKVIAIGIAFVFNFFVNAVFVFSTTQSVDEGHSRKPIL